MKKHLIVGVMFLIGFNVALKAQPEQQASYHLTLEGCLEYAFGYNYNRQSVKLDEESNEESYKQSKLDRLPNLNASISENVSHSKSSIDGWGTNWNGSYGVNANVTLYEGGAQKNTIEQYRIVNEQAAHKTRQYDNKLTIDILQAFLTVLGNEELLKYQEAVLDASTEQLNQGIELHKAGSIIESDYLLLESQYATDYNNIMNSKIGRDNSLLTLKNLLSMDPLIDLQIVYPDSSIIGELLLLPDQEYVLERAMSTMPDILISGYDIDIAEAALKISKSGLYPSLTLGGSIGTGHGRNFSNYGSQLSNNFNQQAGVTLSIPIFNRNQTRSKIRQSTIALQQAELVNKQNILDIRHTVMQEYQNVIAARSKFDASEVKRIAYSKSFDAYRAKYNVDAITTVELLQQQNNYINAMNEYIQNKYGFILMRKILDVYMGKTITM